MFIGRLSGNSSISVSFCYSIISQQVGTRTQKVCSSDPLLHWVKDLCGNYMPGLAQSPLVPKEDRNIKLQTGYYLIQ